MRIKPCTRIWTYSAKNPVSFSVLCLLHVSWASFSVWSPSFTPVQSDCSHDGSSLWTSAHKQVPKCEHKWAQGTKQWKFVPYEQWWNPWLAHFSSCALQSDIFFFAPFFPLSMPPEIFFPACSLFLFYHCKVGKAEWSKIGDGNSPGKSWVGIKKRTLPEFCGRWAYCSRHLSTLLDAYILPYAWLQFRFITNPANCKSPMKTACDLWLLSLFLFNLFILRKQRKPFKGASTWGVGTLASWVFRC